MITELRSSLQLTQRMAASQRPAPAVQQRKEESKSRSVERLVLDRIRATAARERWMAEAWLEAVKQGEAAPLDLVLLVLLNKLPRSKKQVEAVTKGKARTGEFSQELVATTLEQHGPVLRQELELLLALADVLLQARDPTVVSLGCHLFTEAFRCLSSGAKQEVVATLVEKVSCGSGEGRGAALGVLRGLVEHQREEVAQYAVFLTQLLDNLGGLEQGEVRSVMELLGGLAWGGRGQGIKDELVIVVRKQLNSFTESTLRLGVVGTVAVVGAMLRAREEQGELSLPLAESSRSSTCPTLPSLQAEALLLVRGAQQRTARSPGVAGVLARELERLVGGGRLPREFLRALQGEEEEDSMQDVFLGDYMPGLDEEREQRVLSFLPVTTLALEDESTVEEPVVVSLFSLAGSLHGLETTSPARPGGQEVQETSLAAKLLPSLRLLCKVRRSLDGGLAEVDALLMCGMRLPPDEVVENLGQVRSPAERQAVVASLFLAVNWCTELVNLFAVREEGGQEDYRGSVLARLRQVLQLRTQISGALRLCPGFTPPHAGEGCEGWQPLRAREGKGKVVKGKKGGKRSKKVSSSQTLNATLHLNTQSQAAGAKVQDQEAPPPGPIDLEHYRSFLRPLELSSLLALLEFGSLALNARQEQEQLCLRPRELLFLLSSLRDHLEASLAPKKAFPGRSRAPTCSLSPQVCVEVVVPHLKYLVSHCDSIVTHFRELVDERDGVMDSAEISSPTSLLLASSLQEVLQLLTLLLSWPSLSSSPLLSPLFAALHPDSRFSSSPPPLPTLKEEVLTHLAAMSSASCSAKVASTHLRLVAAASSLCNGQQKVAAKLAEEYLKRDWRGDDGEREKGGTYTRQVESMLGVWLVQDSRVVERVGGLVEQGLLPVVGKARESEVWPTISRATVGQVFKTLLAALVIEVKKITFNSRSDMDAQFSSWQKVVDVLVQLVAAVKQWRNLAMLGALLKSGRQFLDNFTKHGVPLLEKLFKGGPRRRTGCISLIKNFQNCTR